MFLNNDRLFFSLFNSFMHVMICEMLANVLRRKLSTTSQAIGQRTASNWGSRRKKNARLNLRANESRPAVFQRFSCEVNSLRNVPAFRLRKTTLQQRKFFGKCFIVSPITHLQLFVCIFLAFLFLLL